MKARNIQIASRTIVAIALVGSAARFAPAQAEAPLLAVSIPYQSVPCSLTRNMRPRAGAQGERFSGIAIVDTTLRALQPGTYIKWSVTMADGTQQTGLTQLADALPRESSVVVTTVGGDSVSCTAGTPAFARIAPPYGTVR